MKKLLIPVLFLLTAWLGAQNINLSNVIESSARTIESDLPQGTRIAVLNFASPSEVFSNYVFEELSEKLANSPKLTIIDRQTLALVRQIMNVQSTTNLSDHSAWTIGHMLGVQSVIFGEMSDLVSFHRFRVRAIDVKTAEVQTQLSFEIPNDPQLTIFMGRTGVTAFPPATLSIPAPSTSR